MSGGAVEVGLHLPHFGPLAIPGVLEAVIATAEQVGVHTLWVGDHVVVPAGIASRYPYHESGSASFDAASPYYEPFVLLAYAAGRTERARLGLSVLVLPYRHPLLTLKLVSSLDQLAGGRVTVGVGAGWLEEEFDALGVDFAGRGRITDEYLDVLTTGWASPVVSWDGDSVRFAPVGTEPRPAQQPRPPVLVGGHSPAAMRRALRVGDGWQATAGTPAELARLLSRLRELAGGALPDGFHVSCRVHLPRFDPEPQGPSARRELRALLAAYGRAGAQHVVVDLWDRLPQRYLARLEAFAAWVGLEAGVAHAV